MSWSKRTTRSNWPAIEWSERVALERRRQAPPFFSVHAVAGMADRGPRAEVVEIAGCGHAPALMDQSQIALVRDWLLRP